MTDQALLFTTTKLAFPVNITAERSAVFSQSHVHPQAFALLMHTAATSPSLHLCACTQGCALRSISLLRLRLALGSSFQQLLFSLCKEALNCYLHLTQAKTNLHAWD